MPILVVDDDPETLRHLRDTLAEAGYAPLVTGDPGDLPRLLQTEKPRLVLLDLMLPGTDGVELMQTVPAVESPGAAGPGRDGAPRHLRVRALPRPRDHPRDALPVRRAEGPVARARREGPRPVKRSALDRDAARKQAKKTADQT